MAVEYKPHTYQRQAIEFIETHNRSLLALEMGLGKTSITLAAICDLLDDWAFNRVLIIAPKYVAQDVWVREARKWTFSQNLKIAVAVGTEKQREKAILSSAQVVTINRENVPWLIEHFDGAFFFDCIVIDESSSFKSYSSKRFKSLKRVAPLMKWIIELTGTPRPRSVEDLWSQVFLLDGGKRLEKNMTAFRSRYEAPGRRNGMVVYDWKPQPGAEKYIYRQIEDISMSMKAKDWLDVPEVTMIDRRFNLTGADLAGYKRLCKESLIEMEQSTIVASNAGVLAGKLLQYANGAIYDEDEQVIQIHEHKLDILEELIESTEEPVMVFYWFKHDRDRLLKRLASYKPREIRGSQDITDWNSGKIRVLLAHPASMGHGLNLQDGGHIIVWFGLTWSLEVWQQANARLHRQGQRLPVQIYRIIANNTVDEDVLASLDRKNTGQEELLSAIKARLMEVANV